MEMVKFFRASIQMNNNYSLQTTSLRHNRPRNARFTAWFLITSRRNSAAAIFKYPPLVPDPSDVLNSATWASLSLEGFWDIPKCLKLKKTFKWSESEFDPLVFLSQKPSMQAPLLTARRQFVQTLKAASNLLSQLEQNFYESVQQLRNTII